VVDERFGTLRTPFDAAARAEGGRGKAVVWGGIGTGNAVSISQA
jgi:hypothetical protein